MENSISNNNYFIWSKYTDEEREMHSKSDSICIMIYGKTDEVIEEPFESLINRDQISLERLMRGRDFLIHSVNLLHYICHKINFKRGGSYIDPPDWIKNKKATTINQFYMQ